MNPPDAYENSALSLLDQGHPAEAQVHALLALASAVDKLAEAHNGMVIEMIERR